MKVYFPRTYLEFMYNSMVRLLGRIQDIVGFRVEQLQSHPSDTPLTSRWLWALDRMEQN